MTTPPESHSAAAITARLRAAGCVFAEEEARLLLDAVAEAEIGGDAGALERMLRRRVSGVPLEHILGWVEFCGERMAVAPGVFVPRRRTEFLVSVAAAMARPGSVVLDLCCGCGALGAALAVTVHGIELHAADIEPAALECARRNTAAAGGTVYLGDLFDPLPERLRGRIDTLLCNTPYVPTGEIRLMPPEARLYEPRSSIDGGADGLAVQRRVAASAARWLAPGGSLLVEASDEQAAASAALMCEHGLDARIEHSEEMYATVVIGTRPVQRSATRDAYSESE